MSIEPLTRRKRLERIKHMARSLRDFVSPRYGSLAKEKQDALHEKFDILDDKYMAYLEGEEAWDSKVVDVVSSVPDGPRFAAKEISTFESVMDHVRDIATFVVLGQCRKL